jgi:hypothetical protein
MPSIDQILALITDDKWHNLDEITQQVDLPFSHLEQVVDFLTEYNFVKLSQNPKQVKLEAHMLKFLTELKHLEQETQQ